MFNIRGRITSKLLEAQYIWIYGSKIKAKFEFDNFKKNPLYTNDNEMLRAFVNADFWEYFIGWEKDKPFYLSKLITNVKNVDHVVLLKKITNPYQFELLRKKQYEKSSVGLKVLQHVLSKKSVNKQMICDEFGIINETLVNWIDFILAYQWIQKSNEHVAEDFKPYLSNLQNLKTDYKLTLIEYIQFYMALNKDNPTSVLTFTKEDLSYLINNGSSKLYKNLTYEIESKELNFNIFPFTIFKQLAKNNDCVNSNEELKEDLENIFLKKAD